MFRTLSIAVGVSLAIVAVTSLTEQSAARAAEGEPQRAERTKTIAIVLYDGFETLDVFGPVQMWGRLPNHKVVFVAEEIGPVSSSQGPEAVATYSFSNAPQFDIVMIPGGGGARQQVDNPRILDFIRKQDKTSDLTISVCTGAGLLAKAGLLDDRRATTNKRAWRWATGQSNKVNWVGHARWVEDGKYLTSSGVSAGTDMALAVVEKLYGREAADRRAKGAEYVWSDDPNNDPFSVELGKQHP
jgi:putative intracellular protease/amidase